jgi:hypothetical protein
VQGENGCAYPKSGLMQKREKWTRLLRERVLKENL